MVRKKLDIRIKQLIENGVQLGHRSLFIIVGPKAKGQVILLHHMLRKSRPHAPDSSVLWCYKSKTFEVPRPLKKRRKLIARRQNTNLAPQDEEFSMFLSSTNIRYCYYKRAGDIMGNTFEMLVLQDFDALTPNLLAQTIETVQGGGLVVLLMESPESLKMLHDICKFGVHRPPNAEEPQSRSRFNERLILSLTKCHMSLIMDDQFNLFPILPHVEHIQPVPPTSIQDSLTENQKTLRKLQDSIKEKIMHSLISCCRTLDQANVVLKLAEAIQGKQFDRTVTVTAARGRGKSAALGLAIAFALISNYSNILVTSPSPENLVTFFEFVVRGLEAFGYKKKKDFFIVKSTDVKVNKAVVEIEVVRDHKQVVQYIHPSDCSKLVFTEVLVVDEAAAIPLPLIQGLLGPYLTLMSSTVHGYEGTGRSLALKFFKQLRAPGSHSLRGRTLEELTLTETIRYQSKDAVEAWLNQLLLLDAAVSPIPSKRLVPAPEGKFYRINQDALFSFTPASERFLSQFMAVYTASNYQHSPNDLQAMADLPGHLLFCLTLTPATPSQPPSILCVLHVCFEGKLVRSSMLSEVHRGRISENNFVSWRLSQEFQHFRFNINEVGAARVVQIATHPSCQGKGYASHALSLLEDYFKAGPASAAPRSTTSLLVDPRALPSVEQVDYINVNFGLNQELYSFWKKGEFVPLYVGQSPSKLTGDSTCFMVKPLKPSPWLQPFWACFHKGFLSLLPGCFRRLETRLALRILASVFPPSTKVSREQITVLLGQSLAVLEAHRLDNGHPLCLRPLLERLALLYFLQQFDVTLSPDQEAVFLSIGLQHKPIETAALELGFSIDQVQDHFKDSIKTFSSYFFPASSAPPADLPKAITTKSSKPPSINFLEVVKAFKMNRSDDLPRIKQTLKALALDDKPHLKQLISASQGSGQRATVIIAGLNATDSIPALHNHFENELKQKASVLWCYSSMPSKLSKDNISHLYLIAHKVKLCSYDDLEAQDGHVFDLLVLNNAESLMPLELSKAVRLAKRGGLVVMLLPSFPKHQEYMEIEGEDSDGKKSYFDQRFYRSFKSLKHSLILDDTLEVLQASESKLTSTPGDSSEKNEEFQNFKDNFQDVQPLGSLINCTYNLEQAQALKSTVGVLLDKSDASLIHIFGGKAHGKSALMGLTVAYALFYNFTNIFVTAPRPEQLKTFFMFLIKGLLAMGFEEDKDFKINQSTNPQFKKAVVRVEVAKGHRKTVQYVHPCDTSKLGLAELMVIHEASSIPVASLKSLFGNYLTLMSSSTDGSGSAGRLRFLRLEQIVKESPYTFDRELASMQNKKLTEICLDKPVMVEAGDGLKLWLEALFCLRPQPLLTDPINPQYCKLYYVSKEALFNGSVDSERFLHKVMTIYQAGDYDINPNDIRTLADTEGHHLFCLLPPFTATYIPDPLCVVHMFLEKDCERPSVLEPLDLPCYLTQQFSDMRALSRAWLIKVATHPLNQRRGYGQRTLQLLSDYFAGTSAAILDPSLQDNPSDVPKEDPCKKHLLVRLEHRAPEPVDYLGLSFSLDAPLFKFWTSCGFNPIFVNEKSLDNFTRVYPCVMLKEVKKKEEPSKWFSEMCSSFYHNFMNCLPSLKSLSSDLALHILENSVFKEGRPSLTKAILDCWLSVDDLKCLEMNSNNMVDYFVVAKYFSTLAHLYFTFNIERAVLYKEQKTILLGLGLQLKDLEEMETETKILQVKPLLNRTLKCLSTNLKLLLEKEVKMNLPVHVSIFDGTKDEELAKDLQAAQKELGRYSKYAIKYNDSDWGDALKHNKTSLINIKALYKRPQPGSEEKKPEGPKKKKFKKH